MKKDENSSDYIGNMLRKLCSHKYHPFVLNETFPSFILKANLQAMKSIDIKNQ